MSLSQRNSPFNISLKEVFVGLGMSWASRRNSLDFLILLRKMRKLHLMASWSSSKISWFKWRGCMDRPRGRSVVVGRAFGRCGKGECYRANVSVPPTPSLTLKPNLQCGSLWRWGFGEVIRLWGQRLIKPIPIAPLPFVPCEDTTRRWLAVNQEESSHQTSNLPASLSWTF